MAPPAKIRAIKNLDQGAGMRTMQDSGQEFRLSRSRYSNPSTNTNNALKMVNLRRM
jgi:hypothetical protein